MLAWGEPGGSVSGAGGNTFSSLCYYPYQESTGSRLLALTRSCLPDPMSNNAVVPSWPMYLRKI